MTGSIEELAAHPQVAAALAFVAESDDETVADMVALTTIPAPSGSEGARGEWLSRRFAAAGLVVAAADEVGNIVAVRDGHGATPDALHATAGASVMLASHLDTVFAAGTDLTTRRRGEKICTPGISDNGRGVAAIIRVAHALHHAGIRTRRAIMFVGTVGEEGAGDLRGVKHLFAKRTTDGKRSPDAARCNVFIAVDGAGVNRIVHRAVGSRRLRITIRGPGGHSWNDRGTAHPAHALASIIADAATTPSYPHSSFSVGRIESGTGINVIPVDAFADVDIRSEDTSEIMRIESLLRTNVTRVVDAANAARKDGTGALSFTIASIGDRPGGVTAADADVVRLAWDASRHFGVDPVLTSSSTDANVPMSVGIPSIAIGAGGDAGGMHTEDEWYSNEGGATGIKRLLLLVLTLAEVVGD